MGVPATTPDKIERCLACNCPYPKTACTDGYDERHLAGLRAAGVHIFWRIQTDSVDAAVVRLPAPCPDQTFPDGNPAFQCPVVTGEDNPSQG